MIPAVLGALGFVIFLCLCFAAKVIFFRLTERKEDPEWVAMQLEELRATCESASKTQTRANQAREEIDKREREESVNSGG